MLSQSRRGRSHGRRPRPQQTRRARWPTILGGLVVVAALAAGVLAGHQATSASNTAIDGLMTFSNLARDHVDGPVNYPQVPPVGGPHNPVWMNCGIYNAPIPNENAVHSLEHGAVWLTYQPDLSEAEVAQLRSLARGHAYVLLSPYPGLPAPVVASAWGLQIWADSAGDPRLAKFVALYEHGPQTPEPGAPCSGAKGVPLVE
jgi:Protein of unknown function (DUF3105)